MKKKIYIAILIIWTLVGLSLLTTISFTDKFGLSKAVITNIVRIFVVASCILAGAFCWLKNKE